MLLATENSRKINGCKNFNGYFVWRIESKKVAYGYRRLAGSIQERILYVELYCHIRKNQHACFGRHVRTYRGILFDRLVTGFMPASEVMKSIDPNCKASGNKF